MKLIRLNKAAFAGSGNSHNLDWELVDNVAESVSQYLISILTKQEIFADTKTKLRFASTYYSPSREIPKDLEDIVHNLTKREFPYLMSETDSTLAEQRDGGVKISLTPDPNEIIELAGEYASLVGGFTPDVIRRYRSKYEMFKKYCTVLRYLKYLQGKLLQHRVPIVIFVKSTLQIPQTDTDTQPTGVLDTPNVLMYIGFRYNPNYIPSTDKGPMFLENGIMKTHLFDKFVNDYVREAWVRDLGIQQILSRFLELSISRVISVDAKTGKKKFINPLPTGHIQLLHGRFSDIEVTNVGYGLDLKKPLISAESVKELRALLKTGHSEEEVAEHARNKHRSAWPALFLMDEYRKVKSSLTRMSNHGSISAFYVS